MYNDNFFVTMITPLNYLPFEFRILGEFMIKSAVRFLKLSLVMAITVVGLP